MILDLLTREELAAVFRVSKSTIFQLEKKGMPVISLSYRTKRYRLDQVIEWVEKNKKV